MNRMAKLALAALVMVPGAATAAPITWNLAGTCSFGCTGAITGTLVGDPLGGLNSNWLESSEVSAYSFDLGGHLFAGTSATTGTYVVGAANAITDGIMLFGTLGVGTPIIFTNLPPIYVGRGTYTVSVPEPASLGLLGLGLVGLGFARRRVAA